MTDTLSILIVARAKLANPEQWASRGEALRHGVNCISTAIGRDYEAHRQFCLANGLRTDLPSYTTTIAFNDAPGRTHAEVLAALDVAIAWVRAHAPQTDAPPPSAKSWAAYAQSGRG